MCEGPLEDDSAPRWKEPGSRNQEREKQIFIELLGLGGYFLQLT